MQFYISDNQTLIDFKYQSIYKTADFLVIDGQKLTVQEILDNINQTSIFSDPENIIISNGNILLTADLESVNMFNQITKNIICFITLKTKEKLNQKNWINQKFITLQRPTTSEVKSLVQEELKKSQTKFSDELAFDKFMELITMFNREDPLYNPFYIVNELNKLITYSFPNPIDTSVIENLIDNKVDTVIFNLVNHLLLHEGDKMLKLYENLLLSAGNTPSKLTCIIASQLFRLKMVKVNMVKHLNPYEFLPKIKLSLPWYNINRSILENTTVEQLNLLLKKLYTLDYNILVGTVHSQYALKTFLLQNV